MALFAWREACGSSRLGSFWAWITGVALNFLMSWEAGQATGKWRGKTRRANLLEGLVVDEACGILWEIELSLLDVLAELPETSTESAPFHFGAGRG